MNDAAINPTLVDWHGRDGLRYRASWRDGVLVFKPRIRSLRDLVVWASGKSNFYITKILNILWNATSYSFPATLYFALWTSALTASSTGATSGEAAYTSYARVAVTANTTNFPASSGGSNITNGTAITWPANTGGAETETYLAVLDVATLGSGNILYWGSITSTTINGGDTPQINTSGLTASEA